MSSFATSTTAGNGVCALIEERYTSGIMFSDLDQALAIAKSNLGTQGSSRDAEITALLEASAGTDSTGATRYRPYIVAAYFLPLWGAIDRQMLISADGAKWLSPADMLPFIQSLLTLQESADCGLNIDPCWRVDSLRLRSTCGCKADDGGGLMIESLAATVI